MAWKGGFMHILGRNEQESCTCIVMVMLPGFEWLARNTMKTCDGQMRVGHKWLNKMYTIHQHMANTCDYDSGSTNVNKQYGGYMFATLSISFHD